jgi:Flp pilus assembly pilin Flp
MRRINAIARKFIREEEGAVVTEYGMLIVVIVIGMSAVLFSFRNRIGQWFDNIATNLNNVGQNQTP